MTIFPIDSGAAAWVVSMVFLILIGSVVIIAGCGAVYALIKTVQFVAKAAYAASYRNKRIRPEDLCVRFGGVTHRLVDNPDWRLEVHLGHRFSVVDYKRKEELANTWTSGIRNLTIIVNVIKP